MPGVYSPGINLILIVLYLQSGFLGGQFHRNGWSTPSEFYENG